MKKIFHLYKKINKSNRYYGSLSALCKDNKDLMASKSKLDKWDFNESFENGLCVIIKSTMKTTGDVSNTPIHELLSDNNGLTLLDNSRLLSAFAVEIANLTLSHHDEAIIDGIRFSSLLLDIGKCCNSFQKTINNKNKNEKFKFSYNEIGWAFLTKHLHDKGSDFILDCIYWNNGISTNKNKQMGSYNNNNVMDTIDESDKSRMLGFLNEILPIADYNHHFDDIKLDAPMYLSKNRIENAKKTFTRTCVISADKLICSLDVNKLREISEKQDVGEIRKLIDGLTRRDFYNDRLSFVDYDQNRVQLQIDIVGSCRDEQTTIMNAPSGFGKTLIGVLWNLSFGNKKMIWVCPRNDVAKSVYINILKELHSLGIMSDISVELYLTGKREKTNSKKFIEDFNSDIIVTNIDNFENPSINTNNAERLFFIINCDVVFDEYHEFIGREALFSGFVNIMNVRSRFTNSRTILLSATPLKINGLWDNGKGLITKILPTDDSHYPAAHNKKYELNTVMLGSINDLDVKPKTSSVVVLNSIGNSQIVQNQIGSSKLIHSKFSPPDKNGIFEHIYDGFDKNSSRFFSKGNITGTHVIQASLDISFLNLHESVLSPQSTLQRIGRCDRFGDYGKTAKISIYKFNEKKSGENLMKGIMYTKELSDKWFDFIGKYSGKAMNLDKFYEIYNEFHKINSIEINKYIENCHDKSLLNFTKIFPRHYNGKTKKGERLTANSNRLRSNGDEIFFICEMADSKGKYSDAISENNHSHFSRYDEDDKTIGRMKKAMKTIRDSGDERYDYASMIDEWDINAMRESAKYSDTPYIRFDVVYHREYGVIKKSILNSMTNQ